MRLRSLVWFSLIWLLLPLGVIAAQLYMSSVFLSGASYQIADQVRGYGASVLVQPFTCLVACVVGLRLRRSELLRSVAVLRTRMLVCAQLVALPAVGATAVLSATMAVTTYPADGNLLPDPRLLTVALVQSAAFATAGLALGLALRPVLAAPVAVLLPYMLIAFPPTSEILWIRHLTWISTGCCNIYEDLSTRAVTAHVLFLLALLGGALVIAGIFIRTAAEPPVSRVAPAASAGSFLLAVIIASPLGASPVDIRHGQPACQPVGSTQLCLWPEHEPARAQAEAVLQQVMEIAATSKIAVPSTFTERDPSTVRWPVTSVDIAPRRDLATVRSSLASSLYPSTQCVEPDPENDVASAAPDIDDRSVVQLWWERRLGVQNNREYGDPAVLAVVSRLERLSQRQQAQEINTRIRTAAAACRTEPAS